MTRDDIIKLAGDCDLGRVCGPLDTLLSYEWEYLQRFANLVAAAEREACAAMFDDHNVWDEEVGERIRARGTT
jgi:hypothetical protein